MKSGLKIRLDGPQVTGTDPHAVLEVSHSQPLEIFPQPVPKTAFALLDVIYQNPPQAIPSGIPQSIGPQFIRHRITIPGERDYACSVSPPSISNHTGLAKPPQGGPIGCIRGETGVGEPAPAPAHRKLRVGRYAIEEHVRGTASNHGTADIRMMKQRLFHGST